MKQYISGDTLYLWGKPYTLKLSDAVDYKVHMTKDEIILGVGGNDTYNKRIKALNRFYSSELAAMVSILIEWLESVIIHEPVHMIILGHSKRFYDICEKYFPNYRKVKAMIDSKADFYM